MSHVIAPNGRLDLSAVSGLQAQLVAGTGKDVLLDMAAVTHVGALCLQLMIAAGRAAADCGKTFRLENISDEVLDHLNLMGTKPEQIMEGMQ